MRTLVTGGAGFIGSHLCERLLAQGHEVLCMDNFYTGRRQNIEHLADQPGFALLAHDVVDPVPDQVVADTAAGTTAGTTAGTIDRIFHLACPASPVHYQRDPVKTIQTSVLGTMHMLELARRTGARMLQASTSEVYGDPTVHPQTEAYWGNVNPIGPRSCYDEGKRVAETLCFDYHRHRNVDIRVVRIFNTYGPRMAASDGRVVSNFVVQALKGQDITLYGDGSQTRSFCYVDELVDALVRMMDQTGHPGPVNLGNPEEFTIRHLAELVIELTGSSSTLVHRPLPPDDPVQRCPDITRARTLLGWTPRIALRQGLAATIDHFQALLRAGVLS